MLQCVEMEAAGLEVKINFTISVVLGAGWIFSKEQFFNRSLSFLSFGKLRVSYGTTGNDQIGDYSYYDLFSPTSSFGYQGIIGLTPQSFSNPFLAWEETKKAEGGLELRFSTQTGYCLMFLLPK